MTQQWYELSLRETAGVSYQSRRSEPTVKRPQAGGQDRPPRLRAEEMLNPSQLAALDQAHDAEVFAWQVGAILLTFIGGLLVAWLVLEAWAKWRPPR